MLGRLAELREAALADVDVPSPSAQTEKEPDVEHLEYVDEMKDLYKEILEDEGAAAQAFAEVRHRVENMEEIVQLERAALLPTKLKQLANRFESQELVCQRMIRRAKELLTILRAEDQDYDEVDDTVHIALRPVRNNIAQVRSKEFKTLVQGFFAARSRNRQEMIARATRQLRFAYPDALEEEISEIMEFPELAAVAIAQRLESGSEGATLDTILAEMEDQKAAAQRLEQGAKELKLMFLQFAELIDNQGDSLNAIEANIKTVIDETSEAIGILVDAEDEKRAYERKKLKFYVFLFVVIFYFFIWPFLRPRNSSPPPAASSAPPATDAESHNGPAPSPSHTPASSHPHSWHDFGGAWHAITLHFTDTCHSISTFFTDSYHNALRKFAPEHYKKLHGHDEASSHQEKATVGSDGDKKSSLAQVTQYSQRLGRHRRPSHLVAPAHLQANDTRDGAPEYVSRNGRHVAFLSDAHVYGADLVSNSLIRSVALRASGGATKHSSLRKPREINAGRVVQHSLSFG